MEKKKFKATFEFEFINSKEITLSSEHNFKVLPSNVDKIGQILAADLINFLTGEKVPENIFQAKNVIVSETYTEDNKHKFDANSSKCQKCEYLPTCLQKYKKIN